MAIPLSANTVLSALRAEGVRVVEVRSWRTNNRNHIGPWGPVHGVMIHHTVTSGTNSSVDLCYEGRSDLPGPLCHGVISKDGTVYMVGHGRANHAGKGDGDVLTAVINGSPLPPDNEADTDGNTRFYGFECINLGDNEDPWPSVQVEAIVRASAALCRAHNWSTSVIGHLEWQPGKIDPRGPGISMDNIRARVTERLKHNADWNPGEGEDPMPKALSIGMTEPLVISDPDVYVSIPFDTEWIDEAEQHFEGGQSFAAGRTQINGVVILRVNGLDDGSFLYVRLVEGNGSEEHRLTIEKVPGTEGLISSIPFWAKVRDGYRLKIMVSHSNELPVTIDRVEVKASVYA